MPFRFSLFHILIFLVMKPSWPVYFYLIWKQCKNHFDTNLIKIHLTVIEILLIYCFALFLVTANSDHLGMPNCKKSNWLHARIVVIQNWYDSIEIFFVSHFDIFNNRSHPDWSILHLILKQLTARIILI